MAAPAFRSAGTISGGTGDSTPGLPAGHIANDILLLIIQAADVTITGPTGYVEVASSPQSLFAATGRIAVFWKRDNGSESAPTVADTGNHTISQILAYSGCVTSGNPWSDSTGETNAGGNSFVIKDMTTTVADTMVVQFVGHDRDSGTSPFSSATNVNLTGFGLFTGANASTNAGSGGGFFVVGGTKVAAGAIGTSTINASISISSGDIQLALTSTVPPSPPAQNRVFDFMGFF